jgi:hypothetical protein
MRVKRGLTLVGLVFVIVGFAGCQPIKLSIYAQPVENTTTNSPPFTFGSSSNPPQNQFPPAQDPLASIPAPSSSDLNPSTEQESPGLGGEAQDQQKPSQNEEMAPNSEPDTATSSENIVNEQDQNNDDTLGNSIVQSPEPRSQERENRLPGVSEQPNQNRANDDDDTDDSQDNSLDSDKQDQQATRGDNEDNEENEENEANEDNNSRNDNDEDEEEEEDEEETSDTDSGNDDIPLEYDIVPFP